MLTEFAVIFEGRQGSSKWHMCRLKLSCHSNNLIKAPLLGVLTCIPTVGKMSFIMGFNSVKSQSTVDLQKSKSANLRNSQRSTNMNTVSTGCEKSGFCFRHLPFPEITTSIVVFQAYNLQVIRDSLFFLITSNQGTRWGFSYLLLPPLKASPSHQFTDFFSNSLTELLPYQLTTTLQLDVLHSSTILKALPSRVHLSSRIPTKGFQMNIWILRNICRCPKLSQYDTHHFCNRAALQRLSILRHIWISLLKICDLMASIDSHKA